MLQDGVVEWKVYQQILQEKVKRIRQEELQRQQKLRTDSVVSPLGSILTARTATREASLPRFCITVCSFSAVRGQTSGQCV